MTRAHARQARPTASSPTLSATTGRRPSPAPIFAADRARRCGSTRAQCAPPSSPAAASARASTTSSGTLSSRSTTSTESPRSSASSAPPSRRRRRCRCPARPSPPLPPTPPRHRNGYQGMCDGADTVPLTPATVASIHHRGGTVLGSSRGGFDCDRILRWLLARHVNQLYIIGGDGTHRGAQRLFEETRRRVGFPLRAAPGRVRANGSARRLPRTCRASPSPSRAFPRPSTTTSIWSTAPSASTRRCRRRSWPSGCAACLPPAGAAPGL